jgi:hypothetical protein
MLFEFPHRRFGITIVSVPDDMPAVGGGDSLQYFGMDAGIIVAGKAANGFHSMNTVAEAITFLDFWSLTLM